MLARLCLAIFMAAPSILLAQETLLPVVANVTENAAGTQIIINGAGFGKTTPAVSLSGVNLTVVNSTDTVVTANLPGSIAAGTYLLDVQNTRTRLLGFFTVAIGQSGAPGPQGPAGPQGLPGPMGPAGPAGANGAAGAAGSAGPIGATGPAGPAGSAGPTGPAGQIGPAGLAGATGLTGPAGPAGPAGPTGAIGLTGPAGATGLTGAAGAVGPAGPVGATGLTGSAGPVGATGPAGPAGPSGATGLTGPAGATGATGPIGPTGAAGPAGPSGPTGETGPAGPAGPAGSLGLSGSIFSAAFTNPGTGAAGTIYYLAPDTLTSPAAGNNVSIASSTEGNFLVVPAACSVSALNVGANNYYSAGSDTSTITVYKNSAATSMTCSVTTDGAGSSCSDTTHTFTVAGGDILSLAYHETNINPYVKLSTTLICQ
jgi:hypothetical protein